MAGTVMGDHGPETVRNDGDHRLCLVGAEARPPHALDHHRFTSERFNQKLVVEVFGILECLMLVARAGAAINVSLGVGDLDPAEPCWLFEVRALVKVDRSLTERL